MQTNFRTRILSLVYVALLLFVSMPSTMIAADDWSYPTSKPSYPFGGGNGKKDNPYIISSAQHLANLAYMVTSGGNSYSGKYFKLIRDIVLNDNVISSDLRRESNNSIHYNENSYKNRYHFDALKSWQPIGRYGFMYDDDFKGIFDGDGHSISGLYLRQPLLNESKSYYHIGLFGNCKDARISNLTIKDCFISICNQDNEVESTRKVGSLVGLAKNTSITNCHTENCVISSDGVALADDWNVGGLIGYTEGTFNCYDSSFDGLIEVYPNKYYDRIFGTKPVNMGGIVGYIDNTTFNVERCKTNGDLLYKQNEEGGTSDAIYVGGIIGCCDDSQTKGQYVAHCVNGMNISVFGQNYFDSNRNVNTFGIIASTAKCVECANLGFINLGGNESNVNYERTGTNQIKMGGINKLGRAENCFNYGDFTFPLYLNYANDLTIYLWSGTTSVNCFAYNKIAYNFKNGEPWIYTYPKEDNNIYYTEVYNRRTGELTNTLSNVDKSKFTDKAYSTELNTQLGDQKYGQMDDANSSYNGYLWLKSLGASMISLNGSGTEADPYLVSSLADLKFLAKIFASDEKTEGKVFKLTTNLDVSNIQTEDYQSIGSKDHPFDGVFDGAGHYIRGLNLKYKSLFGVVTGTVKNLALDIYIKNINCSEDFGAITNQVGDGTKAALIENCTVTGNIIYENSLIGGDIAGICNSLKSGSTIKNCSFVGKVGIKISDNLAPLYFNIGGIATEAEGTIENCFSTFEQDYNFEKPKEEVFFITVGGIVAEKKNGATLTNNYYQTGNVVSNNVSSLTEAEFGGVTAVDKNIEASKLGSAWIDGFYHPVVKDDYHYDCTDYKGNAVALDQFVGTPTNNDILTLVPTDEQKTDTKMWQLPNVAVYNEEFDAEYLVNFNIIPDTKTESYPLHYKPSKDGVSIKGMVNYPWVVNKNAVNWHSFCLPGEVSLANLPEGCKLFVGGKLVKDTEGSKSKMNIVEVETVPAGVPFLLRYDNQTDADTLNITAIGTLTMTPQTADENSSLEGTFVGRPGGTYSYNSVTEETADGDTKVYMLNGSGADCFSAFVAYASTSKVELVNYLLLDEQSNETDDIIAAHNGKSVNIKLRRNIKTGGWNTVCLPFNVSKDEIETALGTVTSIEELTSISYDVTSASVVLQFSAASSIEAGKPYLVYPEKEGNIFDLGARTIVGTSTDKTYDVTFTDGSSVKISMIGSYGKTALLSTNDENQYFIQQDKLYRVVGNPVVSLGYRCWFKATDATGSQAQQLKSARIIHSDGSATDIKLVDTGLGNQTTRIYDLQGIRHSEMQRGMNIVGGKKIIK